MTHRTLLILALLLLPFSLHAQAGFVSAGGDARSMSGSLSHSVGQLVVSNASDKATAAQCVTASVNEGLQQTYSVQELRNTGTPIASDMISIFPNPTTDGISIRTSPSDSTFNFALFTIDGRLLQHGAIEQYEQYIDMSTYPSGSYLLTIAEGTNENKYRIIKTR